MGTESLPSDEDGQARHVGGVAALYRRYVRWPYLLVALAAYLILALLGLYTNLKFWSLFDLDYFRYAGFGDYWLAPVSFLRLLIAPSFLVALATFTIILVLVAGCCGYLFMRVRSSLRHAWPRRTMPADHVLPFRHDWQDHATLRSCLVGLSARPLWAAPILALAAILAINVNAAAEKHELDSFAKLIQRTYPEDKGQRLGPAYSHYELVSLRTLAPTDRRKPLVRLRSTDNFVLYYDVLGDEPLVMSADTVAGEVADANLADAAPPGPGATLPVGLPDAAGAIGHRPTGETAAPRDGSDGAVSQSPAAEQVLPSAGMTSPGHEPMTMAGERSAAGQSSNPGLALVTTAQGEPASPATSLSVQEPQAPAPASPTPPAQQQPAAPGPVAAHDGLDTIATSVRQSQGSLESLKASMQQLQAAVVEIHKFINELDGSLKQIDQAHDQLVQQQTAVEQVAYADCPEMAAGQALEFGANDATLSLEAVGWLFQSRQQLRAPRSADRQQWLVIEGHAGGSGQPAGEPPLALQRAAAVRDFLQSELSVSPDVIKVVGKSSAGADANFVSLYDCLRRPPAAAARESAKVELGLVQSAAAREVDASGPARPAASKPGEDANGLSVMLADLSPRPDERGLLVTVPGSQLFDNNSTQISSSALGMLGEIGQALTREPERHALIIGHADSYGDAAYNQTLSLRRARAVRNFLVDNFGIASDRLSIEGHGEDEPIASNDTQAGRLANRRIDVLFLD